MGLVYADIELISSDDLALSRRGMMDPDEVKRITVNMLVDTGSFYLVINENIQEYMKFPLIKQVRGEMANGQLVDYDLVGPVTIRYKGEPASTDAAVMPGSAELLLGAHALEGLDLIIHPKGFELDFSTELRRI